MTGDMDFADLRVFLGNYEESRRRRPLPSGNIGSHTQPRHFYASSLHISEPRSRRNPSTDRGTESLASSASVPPAPLFDKDGSWSFYSASSTAPPRRAPPPANQQPSVFHVPNTPVYSPLFCEFIEYARCGATFQMTDRDGWIQHMVGAHLRDILPFFSLCWFCDMPFQAASPSVADKFSCYQDRMHHIADHLHHGVTARQMRPDFHFLDHIRDNDLITPAAFEAAKRRSELPRYPGVSISSTPHGSRRPRSQCNVEMHRPRRR